MRMTWDSALSVGHDDIDDEHQQLIGLFDLLRSEAAGKDDRSVFEPILVALVDHVSGHFGHEERLMAELDYAGLARHRREHIEFLGLLTMLSLGLDRGLGTLSDRVLRLPRHALIRHIHGPDRNFAAFALDRTGRA